MSGTGNEFGHQGELLSKSVLADANAGNATRPDPERSHRSAGSWPDNGTVLRVLLIGFAVVVGIGWALTLLN